MTAILQLQEKVFSVGSIPIEAEDAVAMEAVTRQLVKIQHTEKT
jgi:hypothetical protein